MYKLKGSSLKTTSQHHGYKAWLVTNLVSKTFKEIYKKMSKFLLSLVFLHIIIENLGLWRKEWIIYEKLV